MSTKLFKAATGTLLGASMLATAMPAAAQYRDRYRDRDSISAGEIIAGAVVVGGLAAILSSGGRGGRYYDRYDNRYYDNWDYDTGRYGNSRTAIQQCISAVERRGGRRDDVDVRRITDVSRIRGGYRIEGRVAVDYQGGYRGDQYDRDSRYDRDGRYDRGYDDRYDRDDRYAGGYGRGGRYGNQRYDDRGGFTCVVRYGRVQDIDYRGV